jgi:hypothetical protein
LTLDLESAARAYFLSCHVIVSSETLVRGQYEFLSDLLVGQQVVDPALYHSLNAAAFAAFGNSHNLENMLQASRVECNLAIKAINSALQSPETAIKDSTVVAAMLLSTFECLTYVYQQDVKACIDQPTGFLALLIIRGPKQLDTRFGLQIFLHAYFLIVSACIQTEHALPAPLSTLRIYIQQYLEAGNFSWRILDLMVRFADLSEAMKDQSHQIMDYPLDLVSIATKLDDDFQAMASSMPPNWLYQIFQYSDSVLVYNSIYHIYHDAWVIRYWNYIPLCRILLQKIILDNHQPALNPSSLRYQIISTNIIQFSTDICATVPQHAGYLQPRQRQQNGSQSSSDRNFTAQRKAEPYTAGIYSLLFPLFAVGKMKFTPIQQRKWIISRLEYLGRISGISQAFAAVEVMKSDDSLWVPEKGGEEAMLKLEILY